MINSLGKISVEVCDSCIHADICKNKDETTRVYEYIRKEIVVPDWMIIGYTCINWNAKLTMSYFREKELEE